jgi:hypothetical protein
MKKLGQMTQPELKDYMTRCARAIEGVASSLGIENPLFVLVLFNDPKIGQYVSNCARVDMIKVMRETAERLEKRQDVPR